MQKRIMVLVAAIAAAGVFFGVRLSPDSSDGVGVRLSVPAMAQEEEATEDVEAEAVEMAGAPETFWDYWQQGGPTMYPLLLCAIWATAVLLELLIKIRVPVFVPQNVLQQIRDALSVADYQKAWKIGAENPSPLSKVLCASLAKLTKGREAVEESAAEAAASVNAVFTMKNSYVSLMAAIAPLLGLFGTISGMIGAFNRMAYGGAVGDPTKLAGDIGEALITTYAGLVVAIPCMVFFYIISNRLRNMMGLVQSTVSDLLDEVDFEKLPPDLVVVTREMKALAASGGARGASDTRAAKKASGKTGQVGKRSSQEIKQSPSPVGSEASAEIVPCPNCKKNIKVGVKDCPHCKAEIDWGE